MSSIIFDEENRIFSVVEDQHEYANVGKTAGQVVNHLGRNKRSYINAASAIGVGGITAAVARKKAKQAAEAQGLVPGTPEYKKFINKAIMKAGALGAAGGALASDATQYGVRSVKYAKNLKNDDQSDLANASFFKRLKVGAGTAGKEMYVYPAKRGYGKVKSGAKSAWDTIAHPQVTGRSISSAYKAERKKK